MSQLEDLLAFQIKALKLPEPEREHKFYPTRKWRFDFAWPEQMLAAECEGGIWTNGRHVRGLGFEKDCFKYNAAALEGWAVLRFTSGMITTGNALNQIERALNE